MTSGTSAYDRGVRAFGLSETHRYILGQVPPGSTVLELGPSSGYMTREFAARQCVVDAIEVNPIDAQVAAPHCRTMVVGSAEDPSVFERLQNLYDVAVMADVLEHLRDPEATLRRVGALLRPSGFAVVSLPNVAHWRMRLALLVGKFEYTETDLLDRTHLRFYTRESAVRLFLTTGFEVLEVVVPPAPPSRFRAAHSLVRRSMPTLFSVNFIFRLRVRA
jgi:2-polyprenyl-3-methyl-5-hydroxy-6-metoxy-1,4-benzoquinol methylase